MKTLPLIIISLFLILISCQSNQNDQEAYSALTDTMSVTGLTGDSVKLVKTASVDLKVKDARLSVRALSQVVKKFGGLVTHQNIESVEGQNKELKVSEDSIMVITCYNPRAEITVRVPEQNLEAFMYGITDLGYFISGSKMDIEDKSLEYLGAQQKQQNLKALLASTDNKKMAVSSLLARVHTTDQVIENDITNRKINADVTFSTVSLNLIQGPLIVKEMIANYAFDHYQLSFGKRLSLAMGDGLDYFLSFILMLSRLWVFILAAVAAWFIYRYYTFKRKLVVGNKNSMLIPAEK